MLFRSQMRKRIDADAAQRRKSESELRHQYEAMREKALEHLDRATQIYSIHLHHRGSGTVCVNRGHLHLDSGDLQRADEEARMAYSLGEQKKDYILMARARLLDSSADPAAAIAALSEAIEVQKDDASLLRERGLIYLNRRDFKEAAADMGRSLELDPKIGRAHV